MAKKKKRKTTADTAILQKIAYEFPHSNRAEIERKIKQSLRYYKCGPYDQDRVDLLRTLRDELSHEICKREKSQYYEGRSTSRYDFDVACMVDDFHMRFPTVPKTEFEYFVPQLIWVYYLS